MISKTSIREDNRRDGVLIRVVAGMIVSSFLSSFAVAQDVALYSYSTGNSPTGSDANLVSLFAGQSVVGTFNYDSSVPLAGVAQNPPTAGSNIYSGAIIHLVGSIGGNSFIDPTGVTIVGDDKYTTPQEPADIMVFSGDPGRQLPLPPEAFDFSGFEIDGYTLQNARLFWIEGQEGAGDFLAGQDLPKVLPELNGTLALDFVATGTTEPISSVFFGLLRVTPRGEPELELLSDLDGDQSPEIVAAVKDLATNEVVVHVVNPMNGTVVGNTNFGQEPFRGMTTLREAVTGEANGIAVLSQRPDERLRLRVADVISGAIVNNQPYFWDKFMSGGVATLADLEGGSSDDVAVLGVQSSSGQPVVQIRDGMSGALLNNAYFLDATWQTDQLLDLGEIDDLPGTDIGVLAVNVAGDIKIPLADAATGAPIRDLKLLNSNWEPVQAIVIPDYNGNGFAEVGLLGAKKGTNRLIIQVRDGRTNEFLVNIFPLSAVWRPVKMALLPDENANGADEIAVMAVKVDSARILVQVRDSSTGQFLRNLTPLSARWDPRDMVVLTDFDGGVTALSVLAFRREDGRPIIQTINAANDSLISNVFLN